MTSTVVPFPPERARPVTPEIRLARALGQLAAALEAQRAALGAWRGALGDLKTANERLGASLGQYSGQLDRLAAGTARLGHEARRVETLPTG